MLHGSVCVLHGSVLTSTVANVFTPVALIGLCSGACRHHIHMNSTKWYSLTEFVQRLSKTGQVRADQTDKGWFISVIQPDPEEKLAEERRHKRDRSERVCS